MVGNSTYNHSPLTANDNYDVDDDDSAAASAAVADDDHNDDRVEVRPCLPPTIERVTLKAVQ